MRNHCYARDSSFNTSRVLRRPHDHGLNESITRKPPLCFRLSRETCDRLNSPKLEHLHDSEAVFLHVIPKEDLVINLSLQDLFDRGLKDILPELCNKDTTCNKFIWPKAIRSKTSLNNESNFHKVAVQLRRMYCMFTQSGPERTVESLSNAQELSSFKQWKKTQALRSVSAIAQHVCLYKIAESLLASA
jgi:hypothetical protein